MALPAAGDPLHKAFAIVEQLAIDGHPVPLSIFFCAKHF